MINLDKNTTQTIIVDLQSVTTLTPVSYLFELINDINPNQIKYFTGVDLSPATYRYNRYNITESGSTYENLYGNTGTTGTVINLKTGEYTYNIYQSTGATLSISATTTEIISTGKLRVNGVDTDLPPIYR